MHAARGHPEFNEEPVSTISRSTLQLLHGCTLSTETSASATGKVPPEQQTVRQGGSEDLASLPAALVQYILCKNLPAITTLHGLATCLGASPLRSLRICSPSPGSQEVRSDFTACLLVERSSSALPPLSCVPSRLIKFSSLALPPLTRGWFSTVW